MGLQGFRVQGMIEGLRVFLFQRASTNLRMKAAGAAGLPEGPWDSYFEAFLPKGFRFRV